MFVGEEWSFTGVMHFDAVESDVVVVTPGFDKVDGDEHALRWRGVQCLVE